MNFLNKVVLLTGAASGIGSATAVQFAKLGAKLMIADQNEQMMAETAVKCRCASECNYRPATFKIDVAKEDQIKRLVEETLSTYKRLDVLVNNAGIMEDRTIETTDLEQFERLIRVNLRSYYYMIMLLVPELLKSKGAIVNTSSICGMRSFPNLLAYNISKAGVDQLTKCVALELGARGVRCNSVNPGVILTNLQKRFLNPEQYKQFIEHSKTTHALARCGQPEEVANVICFLASDQASFITGLNVPVDGGRHAMTPR